MKKVFALILFLLLAAPVQAFMNSYTVNSGTWSPSNPASGLHHYAHTNRYALELEATSNASGAASITINNLGLLDMAGHSTIVVIPDSTDTPDSGWDLSIKDSYNREIITGGQGTDLSTTNATSIYLDLTHVRDSMTIAFSGMGNAKKATIVIIFDVYYP